MQESFDTKAQSKNIGDGNCVRGEIDYGSIESRELPPGGTDEDYMDGSWSIPKNSFWKNQWHTVRGCLKADGSTPVGDQNTEVCSYYTRFSKK